LAVGDFFCLKFLLCHPEPCTSWRAPCCHPNRARSRDLCGVAGNLGVHRPWADPCDRSRGCNHFQCSHNSLALRQVLSISESDHTHKRALIDLKGLPRIYLNYRSRATYPAIVIPSVTLSSRA